MTPGERQYDIEIIIARQRRGNIMTLREKCDETNTEIIVVKVECRESKRDEGVSRTKVGRGGEGRQQQGKWR